MPVTKEGWFVLGVVLLLVVGNIIRFERGDYAAGDEVVQVLVPTVVLIIILIAVSYIKGERPKWQCGVPDKSNNTQDI